MGCNPRRRPLIRTVLGAPRAISRNEPDVLSRTAHSLTDTVHVALPFVCHDVGDTVGNGRPKLSLNEV